VCGTAFHACASLAHMVCNPHATAAQSKKITGADYVHCNGDALDFRRANLALRASFQPASVQVRHHFLLNKAHHYVRILEDGHISASKGEHLVCTSGPYPRDICDWAAQQTARQLYGASPPVVSGSSCTTCGVQPTQPAGWVWRNARGLFVGLHYDVAERPPPHMVPRALLGVRATVDPIDLHPRFQAFYTDADARECDLGTYETAWLAAWTHDAAVLQDTVYLARAPPVAINGVPRPIGHVYCTHTQRSVADTAWIARMLALDNATTATPPTANPKQKTKLKVTPKAARVKPPPALVQRRRVIKIVDEEDES
jgi:hypothetical protein